MASLMSCAEAARITGLKEPTIRLWVAQRKLTSVKLGRCVRIPAAEIERLIRENTIPAREDRGR